MVDMPLEASNVASGLSRVGTIDGTVRDQRISLCVVVQMPVIAQLLESEFLCALQRGDLVADPKKLAFDSLHRGGSLRCRIPRMGQPAGMAKLVDATDSKSVGRKPVGVRVPLPVRASPEFEP